jgi:CheY-like chemotaxis protein
MSCRILIVDDYPEMRTLLSLLLKSQFQCEVVESNSGNEAAEHLRREPFHLVISDFEMEQGSGRWLYQHLKDTYPELPLVILTSSFDRVNLKPDGTLRGLLSKDKIVELPQLLRGLKLENLTGPAKR